MSATRNPNLGSSHVRQKRHRLFFVRFGIVLFFLLMIIFGLAIFSGNERITVKTFIVSGNAAVSSDEVLAITNRDMTGRYFHLFTRNDFLIFPRFQIEDDLLIEIKTLKEVNIDWTAWGQITIRVTERKPHSVWCTDLNNLQSECFLVDETGYLYSEAPVFSGNIFIKDYGHISTSTDPIGQHFLPSDIYAQIFNLVNVLAEQSIKVIAVSFDSSDFNFTLDNGLIIIFNNKNGLMAPFQNLLSALETKNLDLVRDAGSMNYLDLRYDNKIIIGKKQNVIKK